MQTPRHPAFEQALESVRSIALLRHADASELLRIVPAARALRTRFPKAEITLIAPETTREFVERMPFIDELIAVDPAEIDSVISHYTGLFDLVIQMEDGETATNDLALALGAPITIGFSATPDDRLTVNLPWQRREHDVLRWMRLVAATGATTGNPRIDLARLPYENDEVRLLLGELGNGRQPLIGINLAPGSHGARWQVRRTADVMRRLAERWDAQFVILGTLAEAGIAREVKRAAKQVRALDLTGKLDLGMRLATIARLDLLISGDNEAMDLASAAATQSILVFGPADPERRAPLNSELHHVLDVCTVVRTVESGLAGIANLTIEPVLKLCERVLLSVGWRPVPAKTMSNRVREFVGRISAPPVSSGWQSWGSLGRQAVPGRISLNPSASARVAGVR